MYQNDVRNGVWSYVKRELC